MKKNIKLCLAAILSAGMAFCAVSSPAVFAAAIVVPNVTLSEHLTSAEKTVEVDGIYYTIISSPSETTPGTAVVSDNKNCTKINVEIPDTISVYNKNYYVTEISDSAFASNHNIESIKLGKNISSVSGYAFVDCINLKEISVEAGNKSLVVVNNVLYSFNKDKLIYVPENYSLLYYQIPDTVTEIGDCAFYGNKTIYEVSLGTNLISIGNYAFNNCTELTKVNVSNSVETIGNYAFAQTSLYNVLLSRGLKEIGEGAFLGTDITGITIPSGVTEIKANTFYNCFNLKSVKSAVNVESIGDYAFADTGLTSFTMPDNLKTIGYAAFADCSSLEKITSNGKLKEIKDNAFYNCDALLDFVVPTATTDIGSDVFTGCNHITNFQVSLNNTAFEDDNGILYTKGRKKLVRYPAAKTDPEYILPYETEEIQVNALADCRFINSYSVESMNKFFSAQDDILYDLDKTVLYAYPAAKISNNFTVPDYVVKIMPRAFANSIITGSLNISSYLLEIGDGAFDNCIGIDSFNIVSSNDKFTVIDGVLFSKDEATLVCYPNGKGDDKYTLPDTVKTINTAAFKNNSKLLEITLNDGLIVIGDEAFSGSKIKEFIIPETVTTIGNNAFEGTVIKGIIIPSSVSKLGSFAFANCSQLKNIVFKGTDVPSSPGYSILFNTKLDKITVPETAKEDYIHLFTVTDADSYEEIIN